MSNDSKNSDQIKTFAMQSILKNTTDMIYVKDTNLVYLSASQSFANLVGVKDSEDIAGKTDAELFDDAELIRRYTNDEKVYLKAADQERLI